MDGPGNRAVLFCDKQKRIWTRITRMNADKSELVLQMRLVEIRRAGNLSGESASIHLFYPRSSA
jgi:hypothetical protein